MKFLLVALLLCTGCASYFTGMGQNAATGAVNARVPRMWTTSRATTVDKR